MKHVPRIGFHDRQVETQVQVLCIVLLCYFVIAILPLVDLVYHSYIPKPLSAEWFLVYGDMIVTSLIITGFLPYVGIFMNWLVNKFRCKPPSDKYFNKFKMIRKNAHFLTVSFIAFTYGFSMPILFLVATLSLFF